jgi:5-methylcytosine-specific restriction protein A
LPTKPKTFRPAGAPSKQEQRRAFDKTRTASQPYRKWYSSTRFRRSREIYLLRNPRCVDCGRLFEIKDLDLDHEVPHRGDYDRFWDVGNWRARCHVCHGVKTGKGL